jgi:inner membrane protein
MMDPIWIWGILGLLLLGVEMATGTFYILWFGIAGLLVALLVWMMPEVSLAMQIFAYGVLSLGSLFIWKKYYKQTDKDDLRVGQSQGDEIGKVGKIIEAVSSGQAGRIQFAQGVMGSREWVVVADEPIEIGQNAQVTGVEGNTLRVKSA